MSIPSAIASDDDVGSAQSNPEILTQPDEVSSYTHSEDESSSMPNLSPSNNKGKTKQTEPEVPASSDHGSADDVLEDPPVVDPARRGSRFAVTRVLSPIVPASAGGGKQILRRQQSEAANSEDDATAKSKASYIGSNEASDRTVEGLHSTPLSIPRPEIAIEVTPAENEDEVKYISQFKYCKNYSFFHSAVLKTD